MKARLHADPTDGPRQRAARALAANPNASLTAVAEIAGVSRGTVVAARGELAAEARKPRLIKEEYETQVGRTEALTARSPVAETVELVKPLHAQWSSSDEPRVSI